MAKRSSGRFQFRAAYVPAVTLLYFHSTNKYNTQKSTSVNLVATLLQAVLQVLNLPVRVQARVTIHGSGFRFRGGGMLCVPVAVDFLQDVLQVRRTQVLLESRLWK